MDPSCCDAVAPPGLTVQVCFPGARAAVLDNLNRQREEGRLCDLSIQVQGQVFRAHRCVLAASSPYFHDQVLLKNVTTVSLPSVMDPVAFESVLSSAYTGQLSIVHDDIVNYVTVASFLQMWHIVDKCTEILKRPRPSGETPAGAPPGPASRQQSPSSTECLFVEREGRRREKKPDALPPLATWRRPQQLLRWARARPPLDQNLADSQLDGLQSYVESNYAGGEEAWPLSHDGAAQSSRHHGGVLCGDPLKPKVRFQQRGAPQSAERVHSRTRDGEDTLDRRRTERRGAEADEGVGEEEERRDGFTHADLDPVPAELEESGRLTVRETVEMMKDKVQRDAAGSGPSSQPPEDCGPAEGPSGPVSGRSPWQSGSWSQTQQRPPERDDEDEEDGVDLRCFPDGSSLGETEDGSEPVSQRPLVSPGFSLGGSEVNWTSSSGGQSGTPTSTHHVSPSSAAFPPPPSPPTPSSSSSAPLSGSAYSGKVHFCHCGKAYTLKSMRDRHVKMQHLNLRPFGCPVCTKSFKMKHHLTKHLKTHGGLRPYECSLCGKKVIWRDSFLRHQARCERLASSTGPAPPYGFDVPLGQVKVEEGDLHRAVGGLLDLVGTESQNLGQVFKEEAAESFSGS
uniref:Zinc finger and BTB domain containing 9 n=3 Tax=Nothobranchius TaxID=28779 RepID=A0A1A8L064_9TELE